MFPCSHENICFVKNRKEAGNKERVCLWKGRFPLLVRSPPDVWEHPWTHTLRCPSLKRTHLYRYLPNNKTHSSSMK